MISIAICDDNVEDINIILRYLEQYFKDIKYRIFTFTNEKNLIQFLNTNTVDIVIMDIILKESMGTVIVKKINQQAPETLIIYQSTSTEYFSEIYNTEHIFFLKKPIFYKNFENAFNKAQQKIIRLYFIVESKGKRIKIKMDKICYMEAKGHDTIIYFDDGEVMQIHLVISEIEERLMNTFLIRCHRGFIINMSKIEYYNHNIIKTKLPQSIPIGRKYIQEVNSKILRHWRE